MAEKTITKSSEPETARHEPRRRVYPRLDIFETENAFGVRAYVPGVDRESIHVDLEEGVLTLQANVRARVPEGARYLLQEYRPTDYFHRLQVGEGIDTDKVHAEYDDGVLTLELPKAETAKSRKIPIKH